MGFDYDKIKQDQDNGSHWASYSDLFMALSVVFLLLYVVASLRQGTFGFQQQMEFERLSQEAEDLKQQIKVYDTLKEGYLKEQASKDEQQVYDELMDKLDLLQDEAKTEKEKLRQAARENEKKERALNKYQQVIRNIINANLIAKNRIQKKNSLIVKKGEEIQQLNQSIQEKEQKIAKGEEEIKKTQAQLDKKIKQLNRSYKKQKISKKRLRSEIAKLKKASLKRIQELQSNNTTVVEELSLAKRELNQKSTLLNTAQRKIAQQELEKTNLQQQMVESEESYKNKISNLRASYNEQRKKEKESFEKELKKQKLSAKARAKRVKEFQEQLKAKEKVLQAQMSDLNKNLSDTKSRLKKLKAKADAKRRLAREIQDNFKKAGIKADVDAETGDVVLNFGEHYFDTGRSGMKEGMKKILDKALPIYSKSLFTDKKIAKRISAIEIEGYASPTYKGRYIDPESLKPEDKAAVKYNLDLSFQRAKAIFDYAFDTNKIQYPHQKEMYKLVEVTGKSFIEEAKKKRTLSSEDKNKPFCEVYDCKKAQRVIIKFNLND